MAEHLQWRVLQAEDVPLSPSASQPELHGWPLPAGLDKKVEDFREWLRSLLWELSHLLAQVGSNSLQAVLTSTEIEWHAHDAVGAPELLISKTESCCQGCLLVAPSGHPQDIGMPCQLGRLQSPRTPPVPLRARRPALQRREQRSAVWSSVLGCLLHLCTFNGRLVRAFLEGLSLRAVRALLHCSLRDHWAPDVHRQLVSLAAALMYVPQEEQPGGRRLPFAVSPRGERFCRCCDPHEHK